VALQWYRNRWPWMTLNSHFVSKSVSGSATNWLASPAFGQNCSKTCRAIPIYYRRQKCSPGNVVSGSIRFMQIFPGVRWRGGVKWEWGSWKCRFSLHSFTVSLIPNILHTWQHDSFQMIRLSMTLGIFFISQGHWTVSHQISQKRCVIRQKLLHV